MVSGQQRCMGGVVNDGIVEKKHVSTHNPSNSKNPTPLTIHFHATQQHVQTNIPNTLAILSPPPIHCLFATNWI
jgi:hypothetical protein